METVSKFLDVPLDDQRELTLSNGTLKPPLGTARLAIAKFIAHLFSLNDDTIVTGIVDSGVLKKLLVSTLFFIIMDFL